MTEEEIVYLFIEYYETSGGVNSVFAFARAIEHRTLTKQKARWYQEGLEAGNTQSQELFGKTEQLETEIKRLQELADYRLRLLTKMPSEWVGLTVKELTDIENFYIDVYGYMDLPHTFARAIEAKLKEKNT